MDNTISVAMIDYLEKNFHEFSGLIFAELIKVIVQLLIEVSSITILDY